MRKLYIISTIIILALLALFVILQRDAITSPSASSLQGLPWQIELLDGHTTVFGLSPGKSLLADAVKHMGTDVELAILSRPGQEEALELFTGNFRSGPLTGSLILVADVSTKEMQHVRAQLPVRQEYLETGTRKTTLRFEQQQAVLHYTIKSITFIPVARLNPVLLEQRFGPPELILPAAEKVTSYLYPRLGLNIIIDEAGKDFLQYVSPQAFAGLQQDIRRQADSYRAGQQAP